MALVFRKLIGSITKKTSSFNKVTPIEETAISAGKTTVAPLERKAVLSNSSSALTPVQLALKTYNQLSSHVNTYATSSTYSARTIKRVRANTREGKIALSVIFDLKRIKDKKYPEIKTDEEALKFLNEIKDVYHAYQIRIKHINEFDAALANWIDKNDTKSFNHLLEIIEQINIWKEEEGHKIRDDHVERWTKRAEQFNKSLFEDNDDEYEVKSEIIKPKKPEIFSVLKNWIENLDDSAALEKVKSAIEAWNKTHKHRFSLKHKIFDKSQELTKLLCDNEKECNEVIERISPQDRLKI